MDAWPGDCEGFEGLRDSGTSTSLWKLHILCEAEAQSSLAAFIFSITQGNCSCVPSLVELTTRSESGDSSEKHGLVNSHFLWDLFYGKSVENLLEMMQPIHHRATQQRLSLCSGDSQASLLVTQTLSESTETTSSSVTQENWLPRTAVKM